ncbi:MAG TPA: serine protease [Waterburya sp.]|jgi:hypothetical protein
MVFKKIIPTSILPSLTKYGKFWANGIPSSDSTTAPVPLSSVDDIEEIIEPQELVKIINWRFNRKNDAISAVFGDPDFLPFPFLSKGVQSGAAVCRLVRNVKDLDGLIDEVIKAEKDFKGEFTAEELARIFAIKEEKIFFEELKPASRALTEKKAILSEMMRVIEVREGESKREMRVIPFGTGFLVGRNYLLTNHHVLKEEAEVDDFIAEFGYEQDILGRKSEPIIYQLDSSFFHTDIDLDYTLVKVKKGCASGELEGHAGDYFGWLQIVEDPKVIAPNLTKKQADQLGITESLTSEVLLRLQMPGFPGAPSGLPGEPVNIIQHPKGKRKEIVLSNNRIQHISHNFLYYEADADFSSSGSPVLNQQWQLVGLHHAAVIGEFEEKIGKEKIKKWRVAGQEGIRICRIVKHLRDKAYKLNQEKADTAESQEISSAEPFIVKKTMVVKIYNPMAKEILKFIEDFVAQYQEGSSEQTQQPNQTSPSTYSQSI